MIQHIDFSFYKTRFSLKYFSFTETSQNPFFSKKLSQKNWFFKQGRKNSSKTQQKERYRKNFFVISERADSGLSSYAIIVISNFFDKNRLFLGVGLNGNRQKFRPKWVVEKKSNSVSERAKHGLSSCQFISISNFFAKIDFFEGGP